MFSIDLGTLTLLVGAGTLLLLLAELRANHVWNQKRASYELMNEMITSGRFTGALERLQQDFDWDLLGGTKTYQDVAEPIRDPARLIILDQQMVAIMRNVEMLSISMHHGIVSEKICRDGFIAFFQVIYGGSLPFIRKERVRRNDKMIYEWFEYYALRWLTKPSVASPPRTEGQTSLSVEPAKLG